MYLSINAIYLQEKQDYFSIKNWIEIIKGIRSINFLQKIIS